MFRAVSLPEGEDPDLRLPDSRRVAEKLAALLADVARAGNAAIAAGAEPGRSLDRFELVRELGRGGFGVVYEATDGDLGRTVALKVLRPGTRIAARGSQWLLREAEAVARLNHPNIVTLSLIHI